MQIRKYQTYQWNWSLITIAGFASIGLGAAAFGTLQALYITATVLYTAGGILILTGLFYTLPSANSLEIEEDGFSYRVGWHRVYCRWEECSEFSPWQNSAFGLKATELVTFNSENPAIQSKSNIKGADQNCALPGTFGLGANDLAKEMNYFRQMQISRQQKPAQTFL